MENEMEKSEMEQPMWSVIDDKKVIASGLDYAGAQAVSETFRDQTGVCVVTDDVAGRVQ